MQLTIGPIQKTKARFKGDKLVYEHADLLLNGEKIGSVHTNGYKPRWTFNLTQYRWRPDVSKYNDECSDTKLYGTAYGLLFDGQPVDSAELARAAAENQLTNFENYRAARERNNARQIRPSASV